MNLPLKTQHDVPLAPFTTLKVGGNAAYFLRAETEADVVEAVRTAAAEGVELFVLGGGSNLLVSDAGFDGLVLHIGLTGTRVTSDDRVLNARLITTAAGESWDELVAAAVENDLAGVECLSGIPGLVGGTPIQNVGAYGQEVSESIVSVRCLDRRTLEIVTLANGDCGFSYRKSIFNTDQRDRYIVLSVTFRLTVGGRPHLSYEEIRRQFPDREPTVAEVREAVIGIRRSKSMVIDESDPNSRSAGSFFKNPVISKEQLDKIRERFDAVPNFSAGTDFKIPAAWLIERSGFHRGFAYGEAGISANHTLALINRGRATAAELLALKDRIQQGVFSSFGIRLVPEPVMIGFNEN